MIERNTKCEANISASDEDGRVAAFDFTFTAPKGVRATAQLSGSDLAGHIKQAMRAFLDANKNVRLFERMPSRADEPHQHFHKLI
jgi:hypothetical protein